MTRLDAPELLQVCEAPDLLALGRAADAARAALHPQGVVTYVVDRNVNYTNVCVSGCRFCAYFRPSGHPEAFVLSLDELRRKCETARDLGATQILLQGGLHPDLRLDAYRRMLRVIKTAGLHAHCFSPPEIVHLARLEGLAVRDCLAALQDAGLDTLPGGGAEILSDEVRARVSPGKCTKAEWLAVMREAHELGMRSTATMMFGMGEEPRHRLEHLLAIRALQDETGGFTAFIPWTFQPANTALAGAARSLGGHAYLTVLAISRLALDNVPNLQASWVTQGGKIAQLALRFGANDMGSTMIEENVVRAAGVTYRLSREEIVRLIEDAGFRPQQRDCYYRPVGG
ncbi:MAG: dehypoxanthine futalosine cyclase [Armatimonadetes bacterium]|nr:dehypoxanthine futalosine cyclase [Armatimonadota bacterium]